MNVSDAWHRLRTHLASQVDASLLGMFRILVAFDALWLIARFFWEDGITREILGPHHLYKYPFFGFVAAPTGLVPYLLFAALAGLAIAVLVGWRTRWTTSLLAVGLAYWFLIDASDYSDRRYLLCLLAGLLSMLPVHFWLSSDVYTNRAKPREIPLWTIWLLRAQFLVIVLFSGLGQLNGDWLAGAPLGAWITLEDSCPVARWFSARPGLFAILAWGNMLFEFVIAPLLCWKLTRRIALVVLTAYCLADGLWLKIGSAPYLLWCLGMMFCRPDAPRWPVSWVQARLAMVPLLPVVGSVLCQSGKVVDGIFSWFDDTPVLGKAESTSASGQPQQKIETTSWNLTEKNTVLCGVWLAFQVFLPARILFTHDHPGWTELTTRFSWVGHKWDKVSEVEIYVIQNSQSLSWPIEPTDEFPVPLAILFRESDLERRGISEGALRDLAVGTDITLPIRIKGLGMSNAEADFVLRSSEKFDRLQLSESQAIKLGQQPEFARQYARYAARFLSDVLGEEVTVHAEIRGSLNYRPFATCLSDEVVLSDVPAAIDLSTKLLPLKEPLPSLTARIAVALERREELRRLEDLEIPDSGGGRGSEPAQVPPLSGEEEALLREMFP